MVEENSVASLKHELSIFGIEKLGRYYGVYPARVVNYYPDDDRVDLIIEGIAKDLNYLAMVPIKKDGNINIPFKENDRMLVTFLFGQLSMPLAEFAYHSMDEDGLSTKESDLSSSDYYKILTPNGLMFEEIEDGFKITKGKLEIIFREDEFSIKTSRGKIKMDGDFSIDMKSGKVKMNSTTGNTMIDISRLVSHINRLSSLMQTHTHPVTPPNPAGVQVATAPLVVMPSLLTSFISINSVKGG